MKFDKTARGFEVVEFTDERGEECVVQQSSAIDDTDRGMEYPGSSYLWLGTDRRMHLSRDHVSELVAVMTRWLETGRLKP